MDPGAGARSLFVLKTISDPDTGLRIARFGITE
jgi:hypothetical protein